MSKSENIDWVDCELVERISGKQGSVSLVKGTRIPADQIVGEWELGSALHEIAENYPSITHRQIEHLLAFANQHRNQSLDALPAG